MDNGRLRKKIRISSYIIIFCVLLMTFPCRSQQNSYTITSHQKSSESTRTLILTVDSNPVYWPEFHFWLNYIKKYYKRYHKLNKIADWNVEQNGMNLSEFLLSNAVGYVCKNKAIEAKANELGIELSEEDLTEIKKKRESNIKIYSKPEYLRIVNRMYISEDVFNYLTKIDYLSKYIFKCFYGAKGEKCSDEDVLAYVREKGYICAKYIFLPNNDTDGNELNAEEQTKNYKLLENILGQLCASDTPLILFDELMNKYCRDTTVLSSPNGRIFASGIMRKEFENACLKLKENEYSGIVKTGDGYYVILRMPVSPTMTADGNTLRYKAAYEYLFRKQIDGWFAKMKIKYEDAYYKIDVKGLPDN